MDIAVKLFGENLEPSSLWQFELYMRRFKAIRSSRAPIDTVKEESKCVLDLFPGQLGPAWSPLASRERFGLFATLMELVGVYLTAQDQKDDDLVSQDIYKIRISQAQNMILNRDGSDKISREAKLKIVRCMEDVRVGVLVEMYAVLFPHMNKLKGHKIRLFDQGLAKNKDKVFSDEYPFSFERYLINLFVAHGLNGVGEGTLLARTKDIRCIDPALA